jgi:hypothetical protein
MIVTFQKLSLAETRSELRRISGSAGFQQMMRE